MKIQDIDSVRDSHIETVSTHYLDSMHISLSVKREDQLHPLISGNKWRKLKYNVKSCLSRDVEMVVTFGGAFSNHIYATAAAAHIFGLKSVAIIRGEYDPDNPTLQFASEHGMTFRFVDRPSYRDKLSSPLIQQIIAEYPNSAIIPEGGSNQLAKRGLAELTEEINQTNSDIVLVSAGTGATASGILTHLHKEKQLWVFSSLKSNHLKEEILQAVPKEKHSQVVFISNYHFGGYAKVPAALVDVLNVFRHDSNIPVDPIYNGKLIAGFIDMVRRGEVDSSKKYLWIHTGGLQGIAAYNYMADKQGKSKLDI